MDSPTFILIADDHALIRNGLRQVLESSTSFRVLEAEDGDEAMRMIRERKPHIAILDVQMPKWTGFDVAWHVHQESLPVSLILLTMFKDETVFNKAMDAGVMGFVLKENTVTEIVQCITAVLDGRHYLSPSLSEYLIRRNQRLMTPATDHDGLGLLTPAERNVLRLVVEMKTNKEIADALFISVRTVQNHRNNICDKLGLQGSHALLRFALDHKTRL